MGELRALPWRDVVLEPPAPRSCSWPATGRCCCRRLSGPNDLFNENRPGNVPTLILEANAAGALAAPRWQSGSATLRFHAEDNVGIQPRAGHRLDRPPHWQLVAADAAHQTAQVRRGGELLDDLAARRQADNYLPAAQIQPSVQHEDGLLVIAPR